jgi:hypothetical protein
MMIGLPKLSKRRLTIKSLPNKCKIKVNPWVFLFSKAWRKNKKSLLLIFKKIIDFDIIMSAINIKLNGFSLKNLSS